MAQAKSSLAQNSFFDLAASAYNQPANRFFYRRIANELINGLPPGFFAGRILEIGSGCGFATGVIRHRFPAALITALEPAQKLIEAGASLYPDAHWLNLSVEQYQGLAAGNAIENVRFSGNATLGHFYDGSSTGTIDLLVSSMSFQWLSKAEQKAAADLSYQGMLAIAMPLTGGPQLAGNKALLKALPRQRKHDMWPRGLRRPGRVLKRLKENFLFVDFCHLDLCETYKNWEELSASLYGRGALFALEADPRHALARLKRTDLKRFQQTDLKKHRFNWRIGLFYATNQTGLLPR